MSQPADLSSCIGTLSFSANLIGARTVGGRKFRARVGKERGWAELKTIVLR